MAYQFTKTWAQIWALINNAMQIGVDRVSAGQVSGTPIGTQATSEGHSTNAVGMYSHAEGDSTVAASMASHAEGNQSTASAPAAHAGGIGSAASGTASFADGNLTTASGDLSHASGQRTTANHKSQFVFGESNIPDPSTAAATARGNYVEIVGNGTTNNPSNARTLDWEGNEVLSGKLTIGKRGTNPMDVATVGEALAAYATDSASGAMASFPDGADDIPMKSFACSIEPIQNLNGQSAPYPAGGGKNKLNPTGESGTTSGITTTKNSDGSYTVTGGNTYSAAVAILAGEWEAKAGVTYTLNGCPSGGSNDSYRLDIRTSPTTPYQGTPVDTGSGVNITPSADATLYVYMRFAIGYNISGSLTFKPMIRLSSVSDATFAPYSNVCPISGHSGVKAVVAGKNLWNGHYVNSGLNSETDSYNNNFAGNLALPIKEGSQYTFSASGTGKRIRYKWLDKNKNDLTSLATSDSGTTDTAPTGARYLTWRFYPSDGTAVDLTATGMMEEGSAVSTYEAYNGTTYPVTFYDGDDPLTVYKGSIDLVSGVLTVTHAILDLSTLNWTLTSWNGWRSDSVSAMKQGPITDLSEFVCDTYKPSLYNTVSNRNVGIALGGSSSNLKSVFVYNADTVNTPTGQVVYPLATPLVYQLTPTEVLSLLGQNNCYNDCGGNTAVKYRADTKLYIDKRLGGNVQTLSAIRPTLGTTIVEPTEEPEEGGVENE